LAVFDRFDIVRERLPPDLDEVVAGAMARAGYRPTGVAPNAAGPYRRPADGPLCASFEPDPSARPRTMGQVKVRQEDERTLRVEMVFPPVRVRWQLAAWGVWVVGAYFALAGALHRLHLPWWAEQGALVFGGLLMGGLAGRWVRSQAQRVAVRQAYRVILDALAQALDERTRVRVARAAADGASRSEAEADESLDGAAREERRQG
jgi:hypothetical protein